ncbi:Serine/threonine-protein phosphatase 1 [Hartmannibacter diazotrophicus]|uniref:Serine/threonine-protein phosphatase 1 n=1 Tax=Hartmannibacter diazotrophicus TaxID=1482074 RepID=A0A2C9D9D9_9HYPH|nr:metallophosphoesterase family protein [Hartmannibacter diazotrophicus]SON56886.1 Serine/threonine-protein phosphatase 1 [Hartmannibacter diazotrophicus]
MTGAKTLIDLLKNRFGRGATAGPEPVSRRRLSLPQDDRLVIYAVGDVHGCYPLLLDAERRICADAEQRSGHKLIVMLGDYVDRGPNSTDVLTHLSSPPPKGMHRLCLCGNHDDAFLKFIASPLRSLNWIDFGGSKTMMSYGVDVVPLLGNKRGQAKLVELVREVIPQLHIKFLRSLPVTLSVGPYLFVHAGIVPGLALEEQRDEDLMWIREPFISRGPMLEGMTVIHGHVAAKEPVFTRDRICIDTGAYATGNLTVLRLEKGKIDLI